MILVVWKIKNGLYPNQINIEFEQHTRSNSVRAVLLAMPKITGSALTKFEESFIVKAVKLWNVLPPLITHCTVLTAFKSGLDKFLRNTPDFPPIPGYPYQNNNSLLCYHKPKSR